MVWLFCSIFFAAGIYAEDMTAYAILIIGRVLYGLGNGASLTTSNHMINNSWTNNAAPMAWYLLCGRAGSALNYALNGGLLSLIGISGSLWVAVGITGVAGVAGLILGFQDDGSEEKSTEDYSNRRGLWNFLKKAKWIFWTFAMVYFLVHSTISTFTGNGPNLLAVRNLVDLIQWLVSKFMVRHQKKWLGFWWDFIFIWLIMNILLNIFILRRHSTAERKTNSWNTVELSSGILMVFHRHCQNPSLDFKIVAHNKNAFCPW